MLSNVKYYLLKMVSSILCRMPYKNILAIGSFLGPAIMNRIPKQRNRGIEQIMTGLLCEREDAERLLNKVYQRVGMSAMEMLYMPRLCREKLHIDEYVSIDHPGIWRLHMQRGKGLWGLLPT
ncbi:MAG: hypothetical protein ACLRP4_03680 [Dialister invisus]